MAEVSALLRERKCSSLELVQELIAVIRKNDSQIGAFVSLDEEYALAQARRADELRRKGTELPLLGVPLAVKDLINVQGQTCTCASRILSGYVAPYDATVIARLRREGAVFLGRTNMDEFAMGASTENSAYKITRNPWNRDYVPGGSSGGSAAAVAADETIAALGSDTGGSVRQPASFCGCVGLKPSYGRVSRYGLTAFASSLDQIGPMTKCVRDAAILLKTIAGHDERDSTSAKITVPDYESGLRTDLKGLKIGLPKEYFIDGMDAEVEKCVRAAVAECERLGAAIVDVNLPMTPHAVAVYYIIACAEASANLARFDGVRYGCRAKNADDPYEMYCRTRAEGFGAEVKRRIILGTYVLSSGYYDAYYLRAQKVRTLIRRDFERVFAEECDVLLAPVAPAPAYKIGEKIEDPLQMYLGDIFTIPANLAGICALSVPCGFTAQNLPVGLQILGPAFREDVLLRAGYAYEQAAQWHLRRPDVKK
ncbi:MAG: Asp-tRNA(Asn)/Glu-tRNA(Gln) amidotransferase subunit GatA [Kiritimatiellae bacterium]|nr:Asp-tRNA(Asn)/Glu-tRNA(Gln) amidotransferase subunit GatA [Kiritimatiellia bacterium]